jgi:hypothetical protein
LFAAASFALNWACASLARFAMYPNAVFPTLPPPMLGAGIPDGSCPTAAAPASWLKL